MLKGEKIHVKNKNRKKNPRGKSAKINEPKDKGGLISRGSIWWRRLLD
jgi:hypothetical protein